VNNKLGTRNCLHAKIQVVLARKGASERNWSGESYKN